MAGKGLLVERFRSDQWRDMSGGNEDGGGAHFSLFPPPLSVPESSSNFVPELAV